MLRNLLLAALLLSSCKASTEAPAEEAPPAPPAAPSPAPATLEPAAAAAKRESLQSCIKEETEYAARHGKTRDGRPLMSPEDAQNYALERCGMQLRERRGGTDDLREGPPTPFVPAADNLRVNQSTRPLPTPP